MEESIANFKALTLEDIKAIYGQVSGVHGEVGIVGDFEVEPIKKTLNELFSGWGETTPFVRIAEPAPEGIVGERITINTPDKANATYYAALMRPMTDADSDYEALLIGNYVLGGGPLSSRLADRVRKADGLSYTVGSQYRAESIDPQAIFSIYAISNPDNTEQVVNTIEEVINTLFEDGIKEDELSKAMESYLTKRKGGRAEDRALAGRLRANLEVGRDMMFYAKSDKKMEELTKSQVESALKNFIDLKEMVIVTAGDFDKKDDGEKATDGKDADGKDSEVKASKEKMTGENEAAAENGAIPQEVKTEVTAAIQRDITLLQSDSPEEFLETAVPVEMQEKMKAEGAWQKIVKNFSETKVPIVIEALKSIDVDKGVYSAEEEAVAFALKRPVKYKKIDGRWQLQN